MTDAASATDRRIVDRSLDRTASRLLTSPNRLKLGVFAPNLSGGTGGVSTADGPPVMGNWAEARGIAVAADRAGFEALVPVVRWKGFGGPSGFWDRSFEPFTWTAALAEATESIHIFSSCSVQMVHPVAAAKMGATIDHIAGGRWGLNVVSGWVQTEFDLFGLPPVSKENRYLYAEEWITVVKRLWDETEEFDFCGDHFQLKACSSLPKPMSSPCPTIMNAGMSPTGQDFAVRNVDMVFVLLYGEEEVVRENIASVRRKAAEKGKEIAVWGTVHVTCRSSEAEIQAFQADFIDARGDTEAAGRYAATVMGTDSGSMGGLQADPALVRSLVASGGNRPLVGTPEQIVAEFEKLADWGLDGLALVWPDYEAGLEQYNTDLLPLMRKAGLRAEVQA